MDVFFILVVASFCHACFSDMLLFSFERNQLLSFWLPLLARLTLPDSPEIQNRLKDCDNNKDCLRSVLVTFAESNPPAMYKLLGGCYRCFNIWIGIPCFCVYVYAFSLPIYLGIAFLLISSGFLRILKHNG